MDHRTIEGSMIELLLRQAGADEVQSIHGVQYHIAFHLDNNFDVAYAYNINAENQYFLQRVIPYPIHHGVFSNEKELVDFIIMDIKKFKNAIKSSNFEKFVSVTNKINDLTAKMEMLFLNYNVDGENLKIIDSDFNNILQGIEKIASNSNKIGVDE